MPLQPLEKGLGESLERFRSACAAYRGSSLMFLMARP